MTPDKPIKNLILTQSLVASMQYMDNINIARQRQRDEEKKNRPIKKKNKKKRKLAKAARKNNRKIK